MPRCCVPQCPNSSESKTGLDLSFYRFPSDEEEKRKWMLAIRCINFTPSRTSCVCSWHFPNGKAAGPSRFTWTEKSSSQVSNQLQESSASLPVVEILDDKQKVGEKTRFRWSLGEGRTKQECRYRYTCTLDPNIVRDTWTKEEDERLRELVTEYGTCRWTRISRYIKGRRGKQCRERWLNYLDPSVHNKPWTPEEDFLICKAHSMLGNQWTRISKLLKGRTYNAIRNHWYASLKHKLANGELVIDHDTSLEISDPTLVTRDTSPSEETSINTDEDEESSAAFSPETQTTRDISGDDILQVESVKNVVPDQINRLTETTGLKRTHKSMLQPRWLKSKRESNSEEDAHAGVSSSYSPGSASASQQKMIDAALHMISEDMLPFNILEGVGFRTFMAIIAPQYPRLSQHSVGSRLYAEVEKTVKPHLIKQMRDCLAVTGGKIHITADIWAGEEDDPVLTVQLHFLDGDWRVCRPMVAFRNLSTKNVNRIITSELEAVLLSYGLFRQNIGYLIVHEAKSTIGMHNLFCDYKVMHSVQKKDPDEDELVDFLEDRVSVDFSDVHLGRNVDCFSSLLHLVIKEALKTSKSALYVLSQLKDIVVFFRRNAYWNNVLTQDADISFANPHSYTSYDWNSTFAAFRKLLPEITWEVVTDVITQAHEEENDPTVSPPFIHIRWEQVTDILGLLEPFEEVIQVLQSDDVTFSLVIPSIVGLDKTLEFKQTIYFHFCKALRSRLHEYFQPLFMQEDLILATVLDPRIKLQPFENEEETGSTTLATPTKFWACSILESAMSQSDVWVPIEESSVKPDSDDQLTAKAAHLGNIKRKQISFVEPSVKTQVSELDLYISEPLLEEDASVQDFWRDATRFPQLQSICYRLLSVPASSGGFKRLFPIAGCILRARRNHLPEYTTERLLLYRENVKRGDGINKPYQI